MAEPIREPQVSVVTHRVADMDAYDVWVLRYHWPAEGPAYAERLDGERGWVGPLDADRLDEATVRISGLTLHYDKPLAAAIGKLGDADSDWRQRIEHLVEGSVMRALAGRPGWFGVHETSDGRLLIDVTQRRFES